jgi:hypothetical protein
MVGTRSTRSPEGALAYVLAYVLKADDNSRIKQALNAAGIEDITAFLELTMEQMNGLQWTVDASPQALTIAETNKLCAAQRWYRSQPNPTFETWFDLTDVTFQTFRASAGTTVTPAVPTATPAGGSETPSTNDTDADALFLKNTKRSIADYKMNLKEAKHWTMYLCQLVPTAHARGIAQVFDPSYKATTDAEKVF